MKLLKKLPIFLLVVLLITGLTACHPKDEIAITFGDVKITSATYACMLMTADADAKDKVDETLSEQGVDTTDINYYSQKVDGTDYTKWVKNRALELCKNYALYEILAQKLGITLDDEETSYATQMTDMYWNYGLSDVYQQNGVSYNTYLNVNKNSQLSSKVFEAVFGKGGEKEADETKVIEAMYENFEIANIIEIDTSEMEDDETTHSKEMLEDYVKEMNAGKSFEDIYIEFNGLEDHTHEADSDAPIERHATLIGSSDTSYSDSDFSDIKKMAVGEIQILDNNDMLRLVQRCDITADDYYKEHLYGTVLNMLYDDDFDNYIAEFYDDYELTVNDFAVNRFKVKKLARY